MKRRQVILVGHGAPALDCPRDWVQKLRQLEARRMAAGGAMSDEERELDGKVRSWPRGGANDPYKAGVEALATRLAPMLLSTPLKVAYNEFCAPSLRVVVAQAAAEGATELVIVPSMFTPGGSHSEIEIPDEIRQLRSDFPAVEFRYAWPFDLDSLAQLIVDQLRRVG
jgi:sirohydrochlorin cobaltochelatase